MDQQTTAEYGQARYGVALYGKVLPPKRRLPANLITKGKPAQEGGDG